MKDDNVYPAWAASSRVHLGTLRNAAIAAMCMMFTVLGGVLIIGVIDLQDSLGPLLHCTYKGTDGKMHGNAACLQSEIEGVGGSVRSASGQLAIMTKTINGVVPDLASSAKKAASNSADASQSTVDLIKHSTALVDSASKAVDEMKADMTELHTAISDLDQGIQPLLKSSDTAIESAGVSIEGLTALEKQLGQVIGVDNAKALEIVAQMQGESGQLSQTVDNIQVMTKEGGEILTSVDTATRWMRQKAALVKTILSKIWDMVKITVPAWK